MNNHTQSDIARFLSYMVWPHANHIDIDSLNNIQLTDSSGLSLGDFKDEIRTIFKEEIKKSKVTDGEDISLLLSGGLDSTLLLILLQDVYPNSQIYTYTLAYTKDAIHLDIAQQIAEKYNCIHKAVVYDIENKFFETFTDIYQSWYELEWEDSLIMNHILAKYIKKDCKYVFSGFGLDYMFAWMDLFKNSFMEKMYNTWVINASYILQNLWGNKFYFRYFLDKTKQYSEDFFIKYWEYYGQSLTPELEKENLDFFQDSIQSIRWDISELKKQIYFIISTSLNNRYRPYNTPYEKQGFTHYNPFGSIETIEKIIALNIPDAFLLNPLTLEKKFVIRDMFRDMTENKYIDSLHTGTVLNYHLAIQNNREEILALFSDSKEFLLQYISNDYYDLLGQIAHDSIWYENSKQIIVLLQLLFHEKHNSESSSTFKSLQTKDNCMTH